MTSPLIPPRVPYAAPAHYAPVPPPAPERVLVEPAANSRLEALLTLLPHMKGDADAARAKLDELMKAIGEELGRLPVQPTHAFDVPAHPRGLYPAMTRYWTPQRRLDSKRLRAELPGTWDEYATEGGHWTLRLS
jgi:hypothetical protein